MGTGCRKTSKRNVCDNTNELAVPISSLPCSAIEICLGFGRSMYFNGDCWEERSNGIVPDGVYNSITVQGGCIVGAEKVPAPTYTPNPCSPVPEPCGDQGTGDGITRDPGPCNLFSQTTQGWGAWINFESTDTIQVSGCGTTQDPVKFEVDLPDSGVVIISDSPEVLNVDELNNQWHIDHRDGYSATIQGMEFDAWGHLTSYTEPPVTGVTGLTNAPGIDVRMEGSVAVIGLEQSGAAAGQYQLGGYRGELDLYGRVIAMQQTIDLGGPVDGNVIDPWLTKMNVNSVGSIQALASYERRPTWAFSNIFSGARAGTVMTFTTDIAGSFRVSYDGDVGSSTTANMPTTPNGLKLCPSGVGIMIDGIGVPTYAEVEDGRIVALESITPTVYAPGSHTVSIQAAEAFVDNGILDVELVTVGA